ncbi:MAG: hypothetical protein MPW15_21990 [Candidatus Manganitrophus sp.]|nr:hypothetical protein [Candidatus Manganitrophus sp.]
MEREPSGGHLLQRIVSMQRELNDLFRKTFGPDPFGVEFDPERWKRLDAVGRFLRTGRTMGRPGGAAGSKSE